MRLQRVLVLLSLPLVVLFVILTHRNRAAAAIKSRDLEIESLRAELAVVKDLAQRQGDAMREKDRTLLELQRQFDLNLKSRGSRFGVRPFFCFLHLNAELMEREKLVCYLPLLCAARRTSKSKGWSESYPRLVKVAGRALSPYSALVKPLPLRHTHPQGRSAGRDRGLREGDEGAECVGRGDGRVGAAVSGRRSVFVGGNTA